MTEGRILYYVELSGVRREVAEDFFSTYFYGVDVIEEDGKLYLAVHEKSGVKPEYREEIKKMLLEQGYTEDYVNWLVSHNPIPIAVIIGVIAAGAVGYILYKATKSAEEEKVSAVRLLIAIIALAVIAYVLSR